MPANMQDSSCFFFGLIQLVTILHVSFRVELSFLVCVDRH